MVRTEDTGKKKKPASSDVAKSKKDTDKGSKSNSASDKKKPEAASSKASAPQKGKDGSKDRSTKEIEVKPKKPAARAPKKPEPKNTDDYLGGMDLPSSSDEDEGPETNGHQPLYTGEEKEQDLKPKVCAQEVTESFLR